MVKKVYHDEYLLIYYYEERDDYQLVDAYLKDIGKISKGYSELNKNHRLYLDKDVDANTLSSILRFMQESLTPEINITQEQLDKENIELLLELASVDIYQNRELDVDGHRRYLVTNKQMKKIGSIGHKVDNGYTFWPDIFTVGTQEVLENVVSFLRIL